MAGAVRRPVAAAAELVWPYAAASAVQTGAAGLSGSIMEPKPPCRTIGGPASAIVIDSTRPAHTCLIQAETSPLPETGRYFVGLVATANTGTRIQRRNQQRRRNNTQRQPFA